MKQSVVLMCIDLAIKSFLLTICTASVFVIACGLYLLYAKQIGILVNDVTIYTVVLTGPNISVLALLIGILSLAASMLALFRTKKLLSYLSARFHIISK